MSQRAKEILLAVVIALGLAAFWATATSCHFFLDEPFLMKPVDAPATLDSARFLTPQEALMVLCAALWVVPAIVATSLLLRRRPAPFERLAAWAGEDARAVPVIAAAVATAGAAFVAYALIDKAVILDDERSYLFQAELFARGQVALPALPAALRNQMFLVQPVFASKYPPGNALLLVPFVLVHAPYLAHPLLAAALV